MIKLAFVLVCALGLTACGDDDLGNDVSYAYGIPADVINNSISMCINANSSFDRLYVDYVNASYEYVNVEGQSVTRYYIQYDYTARCASGAKFDVSVRYDQTDDEGINSTNITKTNDSY